MSKISQEERFFWLVVAVFFLLWVTGASAQTVAIVEPLPAEVDSWATLIAYWIPKIIQGVLAVVGTILALALRQAVAYMPIFVQEWVDTKRQRDLHSAVMTKVSELIKEGRWPNSVDFKQVGGETIQVLKPDVIDEIRDYINEYNPQAGRWAQLDVITKRGSDLINALATRKAIEIDPLTAALQKAGADAVAPRR